MNDNRGIWRGKLIDKDEQLDRNKWVEGFLVKRTNSYAKIVDDEDIVRYVDPETLGECTGLRDKNGEHIFEGDIVYFYSGYRYIVAWNPKTARFTFQRISKLAYNTGLASSECEIIGNIYENPELLQAATGEGVGNAAQDTLLSAM